MYAKEEFIGRIQEQITAQERYAGYLAEGPEKLARSRIWVLIPALLLAAAIIFTQIRHPSAGMLLIFWIAGSFLLYMIYFFLMMIPSLGTDSSIPLLDGGVRDNVKNFMRLANILKTFRKNKITLIEVFWNAFLINTKPLAKGFSIVYISDFFCAVLLVFMGKIDGTMFLLLTVQIGLILMMYYKIAHAVPGIPGFFTRSGLPAERPDTVRGARLWLTVGVFGIITGIILIGGMMFPGLTLGEYLRDISLIPGEYPVIMILTVLTQGVCMRYMQGKYSCLLMGRLNETHMAVLKNEILAGVYDADEAALPALKRKFVLVSMNKLIVQEFFYRFPAYSLMPNVLVVTDPAAQEILNETSDEERTLKDIL